MSNLLEEPQEPGDVIFGGDIRKDDSQSCTVFNTLSATLALVYQARLRTIKTGKVIATYEVALDAPHHLSVQLSPESKYPVATGTSTSRVSNFLPACASSRIVRNNAFSPLMIATHLQTSSICGPKSR